MPTPGVGLFIGYLNDLRRSLWNLTPYTHEIHEGKQMYMYYWQARK